jgi:CubicO group peptidase (beta-lactamase class C family)
MENCARMENRAGMENRLTLEAPRPARGRYADGFGAIARRFAQNLESGEELGGAVSVYHHGAQVVDLWGGLAEVATERPWNRDSRIVVFSVTKGFMAMAINMLADRGTVEWDAPVADYWPGFGIAGKERISVRALFNHRAGLPVLSTKLSLDDFVRNERADAVLAALEAQRPLWPAGARQAYHALTYGMYARELFERIAGESPGAFLEREVFEPLGSDVRLGTPASEDVRQAALYSPGIPERLARFVGASLLSPSSTEANMARALLKRDSVARRAFSNPAIGRQGITAYNEPEVLRSELAWASATGSADGVARAYLPFADDGSYDGRQFLKPRALDPVYERQSWSEHDEVLQKPLGWSQGFLKEQRHLFCPNPESFGHAGMGGALGWADPVAKVTFGYVMNRMDWRVRSHRVLSLCHALYECEPLRG